MIKKLIASILSLLSLFVTAQQITIIGHNLLNNEKIFNTQVTVKVGAATMQTFNTKTSNDFKVKLDFGKVYSIYFANRSCAHMHLDVIADNIPVEKQTVHMTHELNVPFYYYDDDDIDTMVFNKPFLKIIYDGKSKMVDDTVYNKAFERKILRLLPKIEEARDPRGIELPALLTGRAVLNNDIKLPLIYKTINLIGKTGQTIKTTKTNRFGAFSFGGIKCSEVVKIKIDAKENDLNGGQAHVINTKNISVATCKCVSGACSMDIGQEQVKSLIDNNYTTNIGGKLILISPNRKEFFANKTVYLSNKRNTIIKKTTSNILGTFVFEDIKPDNTYYVGVDAKEVGSGEKIDFLNKDDKLIAKLDTFASNRKSLKINTDFNPVFNDISISDDEMKMNVKARLFGDNTSNPIGKLKIMLLNDTYQVIDSVFTDDFGTFRFKYLPFLKRFYLSAENTNNVLDVFNNILVYSEDDNLLKIMIHEKGSKFSYKPMSAELSRLKDIEIDDPWLELVSDKTSGKRSINTKKTIIENILFDNNQFALLPQAQQILDKVILVLNANKKIKIELSAHTDSKGNDADNLKLSQLRAKTVREYITNSGIEATRIISVGYGESQPLNKCKNAIPCSELEYSQNRRVEFKILEE